MTKTCKIARWQSLSEEKIVILTFLQGLIRERLTKIVPSQSAQDRFVTELTKSFRFGTHKIDSFRNSQNHFVTELTKSIDIGLMKSIL